MKEKTTVDMELAVALKAARTAIRLKHSIRADAEINQRLPEIEGKIIEAAAKGEPFHLDIGGLFE